MVNLLGYRIWRIGTNVGCPFPSDDLEYDNLEHPSRITLTKETLSLVVRPPTCGPIFPTMTLLLK